MKPQLASVARAYRIQWAWKKAGRTYTATTTWVFHGSPEAALANFRQRRREALASSVVGEVV